MKADSSIRISGKVDKRLVLVGSIALMIGVTIPMSAGTPAEDILGTERTLVIGHRGYCTVAPENTIASFELAKLAGVDLVELDYHLSRDGEAIVIHDATLDRTTDSVDAWGVSEVPVAAKSIAEMKTLDAGSWFHAMYAGITLPTLEEALQVIQADGGMTLIERKGGDPAHIIKLLQEMGLVNRVILQSFDWEFITTVHKLLPEQVLGAIGPHKTWNGRKLEKEDRVLTPDWVDEAVKTGARILVWNGSIDQASVDYAHEKGLKVFIYTINDLETAQQLIAAKVDGIISNNSSIIWKAIALTGRE